VTFSVTGRENWEPIVLPNGWFFKTLDDLALQLKHIQQLDKNGMISSLSSDNWMTQVDQWEVMGRKARANLDLIHKLGRLVTIQTAHLDRIGNVDLLHEVEKLQHLPREES
jgi:hypothetical protein